MKVSVDSRAVDALFIFNNIVIANESKNAEENRRKALETFSKRHTTKISHLFNMFQILYPHWFKATISMGIFSDKEMVLLYLEKQHRYGGYREKEFNYVSPSSGYISSKFEPIIEREFQMADSVPLKFQYNGTCPVHKQKEVFESGVCNICFKKLKTADLLDYVSKQGINSKVISFLKDNSKRDINEKIGHHIFSIDIKIEFCVVHSDKKTYRRSKYCKECHHKLRTANLLKYSFNERLKAFLLDDEDISNIRKMAKYGIIPQPKNKMLSEQYRKIVLAFMS